MDLVPSLQLIRKKEASFWFALGKMPVNSDALEEDIIDAVQSTLLCSDASSNDWENKDRITISKSSLESLFFNEWKQSGCI